jgi:drug/metabolite transporter (DMT)-like permease
MAGPRHALLRLLVGAVLISFSPVWVSLTSVEPTASAFYRLAIGGVVLLVWVRLRGERIWVKPALIGAVALAGAFFAFDLFFWHRSILYVGAGVSTLLANFQVFILLFAGFVLYRHRPRGMQLLAIPLALGGLLLITGIDGSALTPDHRLGIVFGLLTAVAYAGYILGLQLVRVRGGGSASPMRDVALASLAGALVLLLMMAFTGESLRVSQPRDAALLTGYALCATVFGWVLISSSLEHLSPGRVGLVLLLQPTLAFGWDVLLLGRGFTALEALGAALALVAIYLGSRGRSAAVELPAHVADTPGVADEPGRPAG